MSLTEQQLAAAHAPQSVAVLAGAGSGKTHMLVARYLKLLETYSPLEIPAVTFTEAGAAELRARVRQGVAEQRPDDLETLAELEAAQISTIHALCGRIVRDHPAAAGVRPDAVILDEQGGALWQARYFREQLATLPASLFQHLPFSALATVLRALLADPILAEQALSVGAASWKDWLTAAQFSKREELLSQSRWANAVADLHRFQGQDGDRIEQARQGALAQVESLESGASASQALQGILDIKLTGGSSRNWPSGGFEAVKAAIKELRSLAEETIKEGLLAHEMGMVDEWLLTALPDVRQAFTLMRDQLTELKRRAGLLDFNDLEVCALRALRDPSVTAHYAERWKAFLIDEAQDTNPVQAEILEILSAMTQRTLVGDLKQSIYGFRRAAPALFQAASDRVVQQGGQQVTLDLSFRTHKGLLEHTNSIFHALLGDLYAPLYGVREGPGHATLEAWELQEIKPKSAARQAEAAIIAAKVQAMLEEGYLVYDKKTGEQRPLTPGDVAVLTRGWAALEPVRKAFGALAIPVQDVGTGSLLETQEAQDGLALLAAVGLHDPAALVGVLRSPFIAVRDAVISSLAQQAQSEDWLTALTRSEDAELMQARQLFGELSRLSRRLRPSELLLLADHLTGYTAVLANLWNAERRLADWQGFVELVRQLENSEDDVFSVVRELRSYLREEVSVPRPLLEGRDAVTLTTMHSSKGLEWPLVIVADLNWSPPPGSPEVLMDAEMGLGLCGPFDDSPALYKLLAARRTQGEVAETKRLLYVALTRARDHLMLTASGPGKGGSLLGLLTPALTAAGVSVAQIEAQVPQVQHELSDPALPPQPLRISVDPVELAVFSPVLADEGVTRQAGAVPDSGDDWETIFELLDPAWLDWARQLAATGLPAPYDVHVDLPSNGRVSGHSALMVWQRPRRDVLLVEEQGPAADALLVNLMDAPAEVAQRLRALLEEAS